MPRHFTVPVALMHARRCRFELPSQLCTALAREVAR
jgi:hypothetical protein